MTRSAEAVTLQGRFQLEDGMTRIELPHQDMPETKCYRLEGASVSRTRCFCVEGLALPITDGQAEVWQVAVEVDDETAITQIFGDAHGPPEVVLWDWEGDEPAGDWDEGNAVLACPTPWADEQQMNLLF